MSDQKQLIERYVASFARLDELSADELLDSVAWELSVGDRDAYGFKSWQPAKVSTPASCLEKIYRKLPDPFPPLFESLVLSYRWAEVDLRSYRLLANPLGPDLSGLLEEISHDVGLWEALLPAGYIAFGKGPDIDYDPVCFDTRSRTREGDCRIVKIDHEEILCNYRVKVVGELAPSFEDLMLQTIRLSESS
ncbi:MAG TPA: hypothetical protein VKE93_15325 [Candidatus Angelobacter sp.]|nr:hypothetical protein [Candidatus Angelobacter sp.]